MPCRCDPEPEDYHYNELSARDAMLCGVLSALEHLNSFDQVVENIDWHEAGISKKALLSWWKRHKEEDARRKLQEAKAKAKEEKVQKALSKLSKDERKLLGL